MMIKNTMEIAQATVDSVLQDIQDEIRVLANIYDSRDLFGIAYSKYSEKIIELIEEYKN